MESEWLAEKYPFLVVFVGGLIGFISPVALSGTPRVAADVVAALLIIAGVVLVVRSQ